jgi:hypothetical protein
MVLDALPCQSSPGVWGLYMKAKYRGVALNDIRLEPAFAINIIEIRMQRYVSRRRWNAVELSLVALAAGRNQIQRHNR